MRYTSVGPSNDALRRRRRRFEFLPCSKWRRPAPRIITLPVPVILNRLLTDFLVLTPLGRRIIFPYVNVAKEERSESKHPPTPDALVFLTSVNPGWRAPHSEVLPQFSKSSFRSQFAAPFSFVNPFRSFKAKAIVFGWAALRQYFQGDLAIACCYQTAIGFWEAPSERKE